MKKMGFFIGAFICVLVIGACANVNSNNTTAIAGSIPKNSVAVVTDTTQRSDGNANAEVVADAKAIISDTSNDSVTVETDKSGYFFTLTDNAEEAAVYGHLTYYDKDGEAVWVYDTDMCYVSELDVIQSMGNTSNGYYLLAGGLLSCLDINEEGYTVKWTYDYGGAGVSYVFDEANNLYIMSYYGKTLSIISPEGKCLREISLMDDEHYWLAHMEWDHNGNIVLYFHSHDEPVIISAASVAVN